MLTVNECIIENDFPCCRFALSDVQKTGRSKLGTKAGLQRAISQFAQEKKAEMMKTESGECL